MGNNPTSDEVKAIERPNAVVISPTLKSPAFWAKVALTLLSVWMATPKFPEALRPYAVAIIGIAAVYGLHAVQMVALSGSNQAANRAPGDAGPKSTGGQ